MIKQTARAALLVLAGFSPLTALASDAPPRYDIEAHCTKVSAIGGGPSAIKSSCTTIEQEAYDKLKSVWSTVPINTIKHCERVTGMTGGSYTLLESCIEMELEEAAAPRKPNQPSRPFK